MNVLLYGTKKNAETRKLERWLKERRIPFQFRDVADKAPAEGELKNLAAGHSPRDLIDEKSRAYANRGLAHMDFDPIEELLRDPALLAEPILRVDRSSLIRPGPQDLSRALG